MKYLVFFLFILYFSGLRIGAQLYIYQIIVLILGLYILFKAITAEYIFKKFRGLEYWVAFFILVLIITIFFRGIGFEFLGGKSGGMFYVKVISIAALILVLALKKSSLRFWKILFIGYCLSAFLPFISDLFYLYYGHPTLINDFIHGSTTIEENYEIIDYGSNLFRLQSAAPAAQMLFFITLINFPFINYKTLGFSFNYKNLLLLLIIFLLAGFSGHRIVFLYIVLYSLFYIYYAGGWRILLKFAFRGLIVLLFIFFFLILMYNYLPFSFQRAFSFLPFVNIDSIALRDASASTNFRLILWGLSSLQLPDYLIIGKGFAFSNYEVEFTDYAGTIEQFLNIGVLHNGLLGLLYNLGIGGLIAGIGIFFSAIKRYRKRIHDIDITAWANRYYIFLQIHLIISVIGYIFIYGDVQTNFSDVLLSIINLKLYCSFYNNYKINEQKSNTVESIG